MDRTDWNARYAGTDLLWTSAPNRFLVAQVEGLPRGRALDLAAGEGRNAVWLAEQGFTVTAVDFSSVALEKAARLAEARGVAIERVEADLEDYVPPAGAFALVCVMYLHLPWPQMAPILARAAAALAPKGTLIVVGHDRTNLESGYGGPPNAAVLYGPEDVVAALEGLTVVEAERVTRTVETDDGPRDAIDCLVRARRD